MIPTGGCSFASLVSGGDPIGTATPFDHLFLFQLPPPWERAALLSPMVPPGVREAQADLTLAGHQVHVMLIDGAEEVPAEGLRVLHFDRGGGAFGGFRGREFLINDPGSVASLMRSLVQADVQGQDGLVAVPAQRELLVCTHGERDGCCGRYGEAAYQYLARRHSGDGLRVWRVSHFGGHRFAPTMLDLPDGRCWGRLSEEACDAIARRSGEPRELEECYRGCCALALEAQAVERELFFEQGWSWLHCELQARVERGDDRYRKIVSLSYRDRTGALSTRRARLTPGDVVLVPASCGATPAPMRLFNFAWEDDETLNSAPVHGN